MKFTKEFQIIMDAWLVSLPSGNLRFAHYPIMAGGRKIPDEYLTQEGTDLIIKTVMDAPEGEALWVGTIHTGPNTGDAKERNFWFRRPKWSVRPGDRVLTLGCCFFSAYRVNALREWLHDNMEGIS